MGPKSRVKFIAINSMNIETAEKIYNYFKDTKHTQLKQGLLDAAIRYANIRARCAVMQREERMQLNQTRTIAHNAFIDSCNILCRSMYNSGENTYWRYLLTDERVIIGDFACYLCCLLGISAR